jgi:hypothetical protein
MKEYLIVKIDGPSRLPVASRHTSDSATVRCLL